MRRRVHDAIQIDMSLRQSRTIWTTLAIVLLPAALFGIQLAIVSLAAVGSRADYGPSLTSTLLAVAFGIAALLADIFAFGRIAEANRRLRKLRDDPTANVRPLPAPFQGSLFGPYH